MPPGWAPFLIWPRTGRDNEACYISRATAARLHAPPAKRFPELISLTHWFRPLSAVAAALAIDPKCLVGERSFDFANIFCNPDPSLAGEPSRFVRRLTVVTEAARLDRKRLLLWILAWCGLSVAMSLKDGDTSPPDVLRVAELAAAELDR